MPGYPTDRVIVYNRDASFAFELTPDEQRSRKRIEEINGEHSLTIKTTRKLTEGMRLITQDDTGKVREHVVYKPDEGHHEGKYAIGTYLCMWSLQYDLMSSYAHEHAEPGMGSSCTSRNAVIAALDGQSLWTVGTCDVPAVAAGKGCVMIGVSDWERLSLVVKYWHGEIDAEIVMDDTRVIARRVNFRAHLGSTEVKRRFDWAEDLTSIDRHEDPGPYYCRVVPLGRGQREYAEDDETEFDWPIDISEETPDGRVYIEDSESALVFRTKLPDGTYHYPTKVVKYDEDDPELLLNAALEDLHNHTRPGVSYEADVLQFVRAGMDAKGVQLGDNIQCVDFGFNPDAGLTVEGRVTRLEVEELAPETETNLTIGDLAPTFAQTMQELIGRQTASISDGVKRVEGGGTIVYLQNLLDEINAQIAADGGYTYLVGGQGSITYDKAVADPLIGIEATKVTQIKGGGIRIADEKKPSFSGIEDWVWKSLIVAGHIAAELVTAAHITAGYIGNVNGDFYIDLEGPSVRMPATTTVGDKTVSAIAQSAVEGQTQAQVFNKLTNNGALQGLYMESGNLYMNASYIKTGTMKAGRIESVGGESYWDLDTGQMQLYSKNSNLKVGRIRNGTGSVDARIDSLIELGDGMTYTDRYGQVFKLYVDSYESQSGTTKYRNAHMKLTNTQGTAGFYLDTLSLQGSVKLSSDATFYIIGGKDAMNDNRTRIVINNNGTSPMCDIYGTTRANVTAWSDRRMKEHVEYLGEDACDFVRALRPALFEFRDGTHQSGRHLGFYAQDVRDAEPDGWDTETVTQSADESLDYRPYSLDYQALIAPLVAYAQQLEKRVEAQDKMIAAMEERFAALEARLV